MEAFLIGPPGTRVQSLVVAVDKAETEHVQTPPLSMAVLHVLETSHLNKIVIHMNVQVCYYLNWLKNNTFLRFDHYAERNKDIMYPCIYLNANSYNL